MHIQEYLITVLWLLLLLYSSSFSLVCIKKTSIVYVDLSLYHFVFLWENISIHILFYLLVYWAMSFWSIAKIKDHSLCLQINFTIQIYILFGICHYSPNWVIKIGSYLFLKNFIHKKAILGKYLYKTLIFDM